MGSEHQVPVPPPPERRPPGSSRSARSKLGFCIKLWDFSTCKCCSPAVLRPRRTPSVLPTDDNANLLVEAEEDKRVPSSMEFVDTHCHLEEVLQAVATEEGVPSLDKAFYELTAEERMHWITLGWMFPSSAEEVSIARAAGRHTIAGLEDSGGGPDDGGGSSYDNGDITMTDNGQDDVGGGADDAAGFIKSPAKKRKRSVWAHRWEELASHQQAAAEALGWTQRSWDVNKWHLPRKTAWRLLGNEVQERLRDLGEDPDSWDTWNGVSENTKVGSTTGNANMSVEGSGGSYQTFNREDRPWCGLSAREQAAALGLGFTEQTWENTALADVGATMERLFGEGFQACITQGCDIVSIEYAEKLCLSHPKVFASFGCHPKGVYTYNDQLEARILQALDTCGHKAVAWGEFGLDFSHPHYGKVADNRRSQKEVFTRQLRLAVDRGYALVLHSRGADRDTLRIMRQYIPRDWKVHMHSYRGSIQTLEAMLLSWRHMYVGFSGLLTMNDLDVEELCRRCPLDRILLETDAPYLPLNGTNYSHCGQIPDIAAKVAKLKGCTIDSVMEVSRANAFTMYGI